MLHVVKTTNLISKRMAFLCGFLFLAILALPFSAQAQLCSTTWYVGGEWRLVQKGQKYDFQMKLRQNGRVITGTAMQGEYAGTEFLTGKREYRELGGTVDGTLDGDSLRIQIFWNNHQTGVYVGTFLPSGRLDGEGWEKGSPNVRVPWHSRGVFRCIPPPPPPTPKPIGPSGKAKPAPQTPAPPPTPPFIVAGQPYITPYMPYGIVYLGWDGGPDHPNVEVFLSMDNGAETPAFSMEHASQSPVWKQPKVAAISLQLQRYHHYKFVLKAAGKTLSTAAFVVP